MNQVKSERRGSHGTLVLGYSQNHEIRLVKSLDGGESWNQFAAIPQSFSTNPWHNEGNGVYQNDVSYCENAAKGFDCINFGSQGIKYIIGTKKGKNGKDYLYVFDERNDQPGKLTVLERQ